MEQGEKTGWARWRRHVAVAVLVGFGVGGWYLFGGKVPRAVLLVGELGPVLRGDGVQLRRDDVAEVSAQVRDEAGVVVATVRWASREGQEGPRTRPAAVSLRPGTYEVAGVARGKLGGKVALRGVAEVREAGEIVVDLR